MTDNQGVSADVDSPARKGLWHEMATTEDWWAIWIGAIVLAMSTATVLLSMPDDINQRQQAASEAGEKLTLSTPLKKWWAKPGKWGAATKSKGADSEQPSQTVRVQSPLDALYISGESNRIPGILGAFGLLLVLFGIGSKATGRSFRKFAGGFLAVFCLATIAYILAEHVIIKQYNLEYALWALGIGLIISNTVGTPGWIRPAVCTEFYIKTGLVLLGGEVLLSRLLILGVPGIAVSWIVTPVVLVATYWFGQRVIKMESRSLNMVISADMSVCGVSAAIATAAACKAKKEELSFAIGLSLSFTVIMMIVMPVVIKMLGLSPVVGGAWLGGTIDSTGAVAVAGNLLGEVAVDTAVIIKMIQNILIGVVAFFVAIYWVSFVEKGESGIRPDVMEIWRRFPKFVLGFVAASIIFSAFAANVSHGDLIVSTVTGSTKSLRGWLFCLAFVSIGLDTNFRELMQYLKGGKSLMLYVCGQSLNIALTLFMAWLMFDVVYKEAIEQMLKEAVEKM